MGINPAEAQAAMAMAIREISTLAADREAFRAASAHVVQQFTARLDAIDARLEAIENAMHADGRHEKTEE